MGFFLVTLVKLGAGKQGGDLEERLFLWACRPVSFLGLNENSLVVTKG